MENISLNTSASRWKVAGLAALVAMWLVGLVAPLYLYALPFLLMRHFTLSDCPKDFYPCFEWSNGRPDMGTYALTVVLAALSAYGPTVWHRRALKRLCRRTVVIPDSSRPASYRSRPGMLLQLSRPDLAARAAVLGYAGRLSAAFAILLPIYFFAWQKSRILMYEHHVGPGSGRTIPSPVEYVPLVVILTLFTAVHVPTWRRVFGPLDGLWDRSEDRSRTAPP